MAADSRASLVYMAKLAEEAERYDDMVQVRVGAGHHARCQSVAAAPRRGGCSALQQGALATGITLVVHTLPLCTERQAAGRAAGSALR